MPLLRSEPILPLYGQVQFGDAGAADYPQWESGDEAVVFTDQTIAVATRGDHLGDVLVEVWADPVGARLAGSEILDIEIQLTGDVAQFGNLVAGQLYEVDLGRGWHRVRVLVEPVELAFCCPLCPCT